jgi:hypothetical protein
MTTLREVLQQALEAMEQDNPAGRSATIIALKAALAQEEQGPVLVVEKEPDYMSRGHFYEGSKSFIDPTEVWKLPIGTKLYTHPPRREWQGLTTQEATSLTDTVPRGTFYGCDAGTGLGIWIAAVAAAERALKEKNK